MGTPSDVLWPGLANSAYFNPKFPNWQPVDIGRRLPLHLRCKSALNLLERMLSLDPALRISAEDSLQVSFFKDSTSEGIIDSGENT